MPGNPWRDDNGQYASQRYATQYFSSDGYVYDVQQGFVGNRIRRIPDTGDVTGERTRCINCRYMGYSGGAEFRRDPLSGHTYCLGCWQPCMFGTEQQFSPSGRVRGRTAPTCENRANIVAPDGSMYVCAEHARSYPTCSGCSLPVQSERAHFCNRCRVYRCGEIAVDGRGRQVCQACANSGASMLGYGRVPNRIQFRRSGHVRSFTVNRGDDRRGRYPVAPDDFPYLGLELETETDGDVTDVVGAWFDSGMGWSTHDGSLRNGAECKTHPSTYEWLRRDDRLRNACQAVVQAGARAWPHSSTGLHTHVSLAALGKPSVVYRFAWLQVTALREQCEQLAGRPSGSYAAWPPAPGRTRANGQSPLPVISGKEPNVSRGVALNVGNDTVELRYWKGTLSGQSVVGQCAFIDALIRYAPTFTDSDATAKRVCWDHFAEWCQKNLSPSQVHDIAGLCANRAVPFIVTVPSETEI